MKHIDTAESIADLDRVIYAKGEGPLDVDVHDGVRISPISDFGQHVAIFEGCRLTPTRGDLPGESNLILSSEGHDGRTQAFLRILNARMALSSLGGDLVWEGTLAEAEHDTGATVRGFTPQNIGALPRAVTVRIRKA